MRVKIFGAGSIGNHMAHASRSLGWAVDVCDVDPNALKRMKEQIYPQRYGQWDSNIALHLNSEAPKGGFDLIIIGTPPEHHFPIALEMLAEKPKCILIEKPLCGPNLEGAQRLYEEAKNKNVRVFVGYDHAVSLATQKLESIVKEGDWRDLKTLDVDWREHWGGIFKAHPWLDGPSDSYLGFLQKGGGALCEHSHGLNLWQHAAHITGAGRVREVSAMIGFSQDPKTHYDYLSALHLKTENGLIGRLVQDVVTQPPRKWMRLEGSQQSLEWIAQHRPGEDAVCLQKEGKNEVFSFKKTRPDDFITELKHISEKLKNGQGSAIDFDRGLDTMMVIAAALKSTEEARWVKIDWSKGYTLSALN